MPQRQHQSLLARAAGEISPRTFEQDENLRLLLQLQAAPHVQFDGHLKQSQSTNLNGEGQHRTQSCLAHAAGVNVIAIDNFEGRWLLSGGADSSIALWDLETTVKPKDEHHCHVPTASRESSKSEHKYGITHISFYPFDSFAYLSSSYDHTLKICDTERLATSASFDLESVIYSHSTSTIAQHLLVACATQHSAIRLLDMRSGAAAHSLAGHHGAVLSVDWSPSDEYLLASGGADGTARFWDIRRSGGCLGVLDMNDSVGLAGEDNAGSSARSRQSGKAHMGACNGVAWKDDGKFLVTAGHDERVRVWDTILGANTLSHFGPIIKNSALSETAPLLLPSNVGGVHQNFMVYPNEKELLLFDLFEGHLLKRLRVQPVHMPHVEGSGSQRNRRMKTNCLAWRSDHLEVYSCHNDGTIRAWKPRSRLEDELDAGEASTTTATDGDDRKRKRQELADAFLEMTKQKITFT